MLITPSQPWRRTSRPNWSATRRRRSTAASPTRTRPGTAGRTTWVPTPLPPPPCVPPSWGHLGTLVSPPNPFTPPPNPPRFPPLREGDGGQRGGRHAVPVVLPRLQVPLSHRLGEWRLLCHLLSPSPPPPPTPAVSPRILGVPHGVLTVLGTPPGGPVTLGTPTVSPRCPHDLQNPPQCPHGVPMTFRTPPVSPRCPHDLQTPPPQCPHSVPVTFRSLLGSPRCPQGPHDVTVSPMTSPRSPCPPRCQQVPCGVTTVPVPPMASPSPPWCHHAPHSVTESPMVSP